MNFIPRRARYGFSLIELLVVIAIIAILAAILFPVFAAAKNSAKRAVCLSNFKQLGMEFMLYAGDFDDRMPDRRDLKASLPGGYKPWTGWPPSDPRAGWLGPVLEPYKKEESYDCPSVTALFPTEVRVVQRWGTGYKEFSNLWLWRFDRPDEPVPLDNFWGKSTSEAVADLRAANNPQAGIPEGEADAELAVDPYFPKTIPTVQTALKGRSAHAGGRNRLFLDGHVRWLRDARTN